MNKIIEKEIKAYQGIDFVQVLTALCISMDGLVEFCKKQRSTKVTIDPRAKHMLAFDKKGFIVEIETTASALAENRFDPFILAIRETGFTCIQKKVGTRLFLKFHSEYTDAQWKEWCAYIFIRECRVRKQIILEEVAKLCEKIEGYKDHFDTVELSLSVPVNHPTLDMEHRARKLEKFCRTQAYYFERMDHLTEEVRAKGRFFANLPKSKIVLLNGRFRWDLFFESCTNTFLKETGRWCLSEIINPSYSEI